MYDKTISKYRFRKKWEDARKKALANRPPTPTTVPVAEEAQSCTDPTKGEYYHVDFTGYTIVSRLTHDDFLLKKGGVYLVGRFIGHLCSPSIVWLRPNGDFAVVTHSKKPSYSTRADAEATLALNALKANT